MGTTTKIDFVGDVVLIGRFQKCLPCTSIGPRVMISSRRGRLWWRKYGDPKSPKSCSTRVPNKYSRRCSGSRESALNRPFWAVCLPNWAKCGHASTKFSPCGDLGHRFWANCAKSAGLRPNLAEFWPDLAQIAPSSTKSDGQLAKMASKCLNWGPQRPMLDLGWFSALVAGVGQLLDTCSATFGQLRGWPG